MSAKASANPARRPRRAALAVLVLLATLMTAHVIAWRWVTGAMAVAFSDWVAQRRAQGWAIEHGFPERGGWPFGARLAVPDLALAGASPALPQGFGWTTERLVLTVAPPRLDRLVAVAEGPQRLVLGATAIPYLAERLELTLPIEPGPGGRAVAMSVTGLRATLPRGPFALDRLDAGLAPAEAEAAMQLSVAADGVALPPSPLATAFGSRLERLALEARLTGPADAATGLSPAMRAEAWRSAGGRLDISRLTLRWGSLVGEGAGVVRLDPALQPDMAGMLALEGGAEALGALARAGLVAPRAALAGQAAFGMMARVPPEGGMPRADLPVALAGGVLSVARIPIARIAPISWPGDR
jgi:hypothetical protein